MVDAIKNFPWQYDAFSGKAPRPYEFVARTLARVDQVKEGERALEVGCGTGNSTIVLLETLPQLRSITCIDPAMGTFEGALALARYKFGQDQLNLPENPELSLALAYIEEMKHRAEPFRDKVNFYNTYARSLPFLPETIDRVFCPESFHWLAIENSTSKPDYNQLSLAVAEITRVLKPNGKLLFNSNGHLFEFKEEKIDGRKIDDMHFTRHPFRESFNGAFSRIATAEGFKVAVTTAEPSPLHYMFNFDNIRDVLEKNGLQLIPPSNGKPFHFRRLSHDVQNIINGVVASAKMGHFQVADLAELPDKEKDRLIELAKQSALESLNNAPNFTNRIYETEVCFVAQKR